MKTNIFRLVYTLLYAFMFNLNCSSQTIKTEKIFYSESKTTVFIKEYTKRLDVVDLSKKDTLKIGIIYYQTTDKHSLTITFSNPFINEIEVHYIDGTHDKFYRVYKNNYVLIGKTNNIFNKHIKYIGYMNQKFIINDDTYFIDFKNKL